MNTTVETARDAVAERLAPALESLDQNLRSARRTIALGRRMARDAVDDASLRVRHRPLTSVALAAAAGALAGCLIGFVFGQRARRTTS
jgi:ElaB/YqjD/DUF883 family membrane-anchored ribosome-binding protein